jgi:cytochrome b561
MGLKNSSVRFSSVTIGLHWLMLLLIILVYATIELRTMFPKGSELREALKTWHFMLGMLVFFLTFIRLFVFFTSGPAPLIVPATSRWQPLLAGAVHYALFALMIGLPLAGWLTLSYGGNPIPFFGIELPALVAENKELSKQVKEIHEVAGKVGYFFIGLHALAALFHHYILRDNGLSRMLPGKQQDKTEVQKGNSGLE